MKIGFIGMGIMGSRMAANLKKKGHEVIVHNRTKQKVEPLLAAGAVWAENPAAVAKQVKVVVTMLSAPEAVSETAVTGKNNLMEGMSPGSLWIDCSTVNPSFSRSMAAEAAKRKVRFLDAPVAGSKAPAEQGQLLFFVGGDKADVDEARPVLEAMGKAVHHMGGHGTGTGMKMVNNLMLNQAMVAYSEALVLGEALGLGRDQILNTLAASPVSAPFLALKRSKIETGNFEVEFPLKWAHKDMQLVSNTAYEAGAAAPGAHAAKEVYAMAIRRGWGDLDFSAVYKVLAEKK